MNVGESKVNSFNEQVILIELVYIRQLQERRTT